MYLLAWGGQSTIARALKSIKQQYEGTPEWPAIYAKVSRKAIIQSFGDQDNTNAQYIRPNWPEIEYRRCRRASCGYGARGSVLPEDALPARRRVDEGRTSPTSGRSAPSTASGATASRWCRATSSTTSASRA